MRRLSELAIWLGNLSLLNMDIKKTTRQNVVFWFILL